MITIDPEERELTALLARFPRADASRVLEIGCGDGRLTRRYSRHVGAVLAIDPDAAAIAELRSELPGNVDARVLSVDQLDLANASADVVLFSWAL